MRKLGTFENLFPGLRGAVLAATLLQPQKWWFVSELAAHLGTRPSSLQRDLSALVGTGVLQQKRDGRRVYVRANVGSPFFPELAGLLQKTAGIIPRLKQAFEGDDAIRFAFVYGSVAKGRESAASDVDLCIVGARGLADLAPALKAMEKDFGREVNVTVFTPREWQQRLKRKDHFVRQIWQGRKTFVKGENDGLAAA